MQRQPEDGQFLVDAGEFRQALEAPREVVSEVADEPATEGGQVRAGGARPVEAGEDRPGRGERIAPVRRALQDRHRVRGQVRPAGVAARPGALEDREAGQVAEPLGDIRGRSAVERGEALDDDTGRDGDPRLVGHRRIIDKVRPIACRGVGPAATLRRWPAR